MIGFGNFEGNFGGILNRAFRAVFAVVFAFYILSPYSAMAGWAVKPTASSNNKMMVEVCTAYGAIWLALGDENDFSKNSDNKKTNSEHPSNTSKTAKCPWCFSLKQTSDVPAYFLGIEQKTADYFQYSGSVKTPDSSLFSFISHPESRAPPFSYIG
jgi:hypothetical protein